MIYLYVMIGGAFGASLRYLISSKVNQILVSKLLFPWGTFAVNIIGSLIIGILMGLFEFKEVSPEIRLMFITGFLGALTTFSSFSYETFSLFRDGDIKLALLNIILNNLFCILFTFIGYRIILLIKG